MTPVFWGVDFTCAPSRRKPITRARGRMVAGRLEVEGLDEARDWPAFEAMLREPGPWLGAFDFPFGLPAEFVRTLGWGSDTRALVAAMRSACPTRMALRAVVDAWGAARPAGRRLLHRACDTAQPGVSSTSPLQTRYVPVGFMLHEGLPRLLDAGVHLPRLAEGDGTRVALEGYPALLAHALVGRAGYKNAHTAERQAVRARMVARLEAGASALGFALTLPAALRDVLVADASGDRLDAVLCLALAAWSAQRADGGLPVHVDPVEGWIVGAGTLGA